MKSKLFDTMLAIGLLALTVAVVAGIAHFYLGWNLGTSTGLIDLTKTVVAMAGLPFCLSLVMIWKR